MVIEMTGLTKSAFYVGSCADVCSACLFGLILFVNREKKDDGRKRRCSSVSKHSESRAGGIHEEDEEEERDSGLEVRFN